VAIATIGAALLYTANTSKAKYREKRNEELKYLLSAGGKTTHQQSKYRGNRDRFEKLRVGLMTVEKNPKKRDDGCKCEPDEESRPWALR